MLPYAELQQVQQGEDEVFQVEGLAAHLVIPPPFVPATFHPTPNRAPN